MLLCDHVHNGVAKFRMLIAVREKVGFGPLIFYGFSKVQARYSAHIISFNHEMSSNMKFYYSHITDKKTKI